MSTNNSFPDKVTALAYLRKHPLVCVDWWQAGGRYCAIYWNGRVKILHENAKIRWTSRQSRD